MADRKPVKFNIYGLNNAQCFSRKSNFVKQSIVSKVINFAANLGAKSLSNIWANGVTFDPMDQFTKFDFLNRLESGTEHFQAHK